MAETSGAQSRTHYAAHPRYRLLALLCGGLVALFTWELSRGFDLGLLFFLLICLGLCITNLLAATSYVNIDIHSITLHRRLLPAVSVEFRQLSGVEEEGRWSRSILLHYHPLTSRPLVDLDTVRSLALPVVAAQDELLSTLQRQMPP